MTHLEIREKFLKFFEERGHKPMPSSSLLPTDPSVLFTTAGMQQFKEYYTNQELAKKEYPTLNATSIQKCMRTSDIDEVGDESHLTFFEMLGNFSFGGYWKKEAIEYAHEFITKEMGLKIDYVSIFGGEGDIPADEESEKIWKSINPKIEIKKFGRTDNFWGPTGDEGPCGPTSEIYVDSIEIWNLVFNQYYQHKDKHLENLKINGIDTGMGLERLAMISQEKDSIFETDLFSFINLLPQALNIRTKRIIADHSRAIVFLISDSIRPSNKDRGYVLRRLMRRIVVHRYLNKEGFLGDFTEFLENIIDAYKKYYPMLDKNKNLIAVEFKLELNKFTKTIDRGLNELDKLELVNAVSAFRLYESFGLPYEIIKELAGNKAEALNREDFDKKFKEHQEKSRAGAEKKFGGHGLILDTGELKAGNEEELAKVTRLHTASHLLHAALRKVLGDEVHQAGSDITTERLRFDFTFTRKMTPEEIKNVEDVVNDAVKQNLPVTMQEMPYEEAIKKGAMAFFKQKYPPIVKVYTIGPEDSSNTTSESSEVVLDKPFSRELCGGPHVTNTGIIGNFKITKEESISAGTRRIRATVD